jgi:peptidoglycan hydrolase-like protein with peptidoglycan-binding domain
VLRLGSSGEDVKKLQRQLNELGETVLASGQFGPRTLEALRRFQVARGIQASGMVDAATHKALAELAAQGNPRTIPRAPRKADWFDSAAQTVVDSGEAAPESVMLMLSDGRQLTVEQAIEAMNASFQKQLGGQAPDPYDDRDVLVAQVNRECDKFGRKGYLTEGDRKQLGLTLKRAFEMLGDVDVLAVGGGAAKPAIIREE